ncbi:basic proline-rich protein-like [Coturnix japonica]|uniref:basic proline-rich protein-like n=1 Tax=Coturnix japonica TaxID=93934 RepID=UPI0013A5DF8C|nr:basic proline-rich protein-like [Coturnix japonica]
MALPPGGDPCPGPTPGLSQPHRPGFVPAGRPVPPPSLPRPPSAAGSASTLEAGPGVSSLIPTLPEREGRRDFEPMETAGSTGPSGVSSRPHYGPCCIKPSPRPHDGCGSAVPPAPDRQGQEEPEPPSPLDLAGSCCSTVRGQLRGMRPADGTWRGTCSIPVLAEFCPLCCRPFPFCASIPGV